MELREYWLILRRWLWLIVLGTVLAALTAFIVSYNTEPVYQSTVTMRIDPSTGRLTNEYAGLLVAEQLAGTYAQQMTMRPVMETAIQELANEGRPIGMTPNQLAGTVTVSPVRDTQLIRLSVENTDPEMAAVIANQIADVFRFQNEQFEQDRFADSKQNLLNEMAKVEEELDATKVAIGALESLEDKASEQDRELERLTVARNVQREAYSNLVASYEELRIAEASEASNVVVVESAAPNFAPIRPRTMQNTMLAAAVGGMLALGVVFLVEYLDDTVKTPDDVTMVTNLSTLGAIGQIEGTYAKDKLVTLLAPRSPLAEGYRALRTNIQFASVDGPLRTVLVTSPGPGEGKSTTAANLAVVLAQAGRQVILVDADLRRPNLHRFFELPNGQGLTTALLDFQTPAIRHVQPTAMPGLRVLTSGPIPPNPAELLGSQRQAELLQSLQEEVDVVILDSPPVLTVTDALVLAQLVNGVLLVIDAGSTRREALLKARDALVHSEGRIFGVALNRLTPRRSGYYYYQYYQYYTSRYEKEDARPKPKRGLLSGLRR